MTRKSEARLHGDPTYRFEGFELDLRERDLRQNGVRIKLQEQPLQLLELLLQTPGALVMRDELARRLWPDLHVSFDRSLNTAVNALRQALGDSPRNPRFIETRAGLGYRFIAPVEVIGSSNDTSAGSVEAHQNYLKGRYFYDKMREDDLHKSVAYFEAALAEDPHYALAYTGLADCYVQFAFLDVAPPREAHKRAHESAMTAIDSDGNLAEAHVSLGNVKKVFDWDWTGAEAEYRRALELNANCVSVHASYADFLSARARHEEALRRIRRALELDPLSLVLNMELAWDLYLSRDYQASMEQCWKTLAMEPRFAPAQHTLGLVYEQLGLHEEAIVELQNARACSQDQPMMMAALGHAYAGAGNRRDAEAVLGELEAMAQWRHVSSYGLSLVYAGLGDFDAASEWLAKAQADGDVWSMWRMVDPRLAAVQNPTAGKGLYRRS